MALTATQTNQLSNINKQKAAAQRDGNTALVQQLQTKYDSLKASFAPANTAVVKVNMPNDSGGYLENMTDAQVQEAIAARKAGKDVVINSNKVSYSLDKNRANQLFDYMIAKKLPATVAGFGEAQIPSGAFTPGNSNSLIGAVGSLAKDFGPSIAGMLAGGAGLNALAGMGGTGAGVAGASGTVGDTAAVLQAANPGLSAAEAMTAAEAYANAGVSASTLAQAAGVPASVFTAPTSGVTGASLAQNAASPIASAVTGGATTAPSTLAQLPAGGMTATGSIPAGTTATMGVPAATAGAGMTDSVVSAALNPATAGNVGLASGLGTGAAGISEALTGVAPAATTAAGTVASTVANAGTTATTAAPSWLDYITSGLGLASGISQAFGSSGQIDANAIRNAVDPFAPYRGQYAAQLNTMMANPSSVTSLPGYQFLQQQGEQGVMRQLAAQGKTASGAEMLALREQDQGLANKFYNDQYTKLATLSGASSSPATGGDAYGNTLATNLATQQSGLDSIAQAAGAFRTILNPQQPTQTNTPR